MKPGTSGLLERAADDDATLHLPGLLEIPFGQHAQAAIEKRIKALINEHGEKYPRTHDLERLARKLDDFGETLPLVQISLRDLSD